MGNPQRQDAEYVSVERRIRISPQILAVITAPGYKSPPVRVSATDDGTYLEFVFYTHACEVSEETTLIDVPTLAERHQRHYQSCDCLGDKAICCDPTCPCHETAQFDGSECVT